jgi:hypothetical protein
MDQVLSLCCLSNEKLSNLLIRKEAFLLYKKKSLAVLFLAASQPASQPADPSYCHILKMK